MAIAGDDDQNQALRYLEEGYGKHTQGQLAEAIGLYLKSIGLHPTAEAHTFLGWAYSMQGKYQEAIDACQKAIEVDPDFGNPYNDIGSYLIETGKYDEALPWLEKAVGAKRYDSYFYPHYNMGRIWEKKGDWNRALNCYQRSLAMNAQYVLAKKAVNRLLGMLN